MISIAVNGGDIFEKAETARESWNIAVEKENKSLMDLLNYFSEDLVAGEVNDEAPGILEHEQGGPYFINCIEDLVAFAYNVNNGNTYEGETIKLGLTLDFNENKSYRNPETKYIKDEYGYTPNESGEPIKTLLTSREGIGFFPVGATYNNTFAGTLDGNNCGILNLYENTSSYRRIFRKCI